MNLMTTNVNGWQLPIISSLNQLIELSGNWICPQQKDIYRAIELVRPDTCKVVILGQDPYHTVGKANGLAFGLHRNYKGSIRYSSFGNIIGEVERWARDQSIPQCYTDVSLSIDTSLESWARQGVLLLNTRLTVEPGKPLSHSGFGWELVVASILAQVPIDAVWLLWGAQARIIGEEFSRPDLTLTASHPSKYSASRRTGTKVPAFNGCNCFTAANKLLVNLGKEPIQWATLSPSGAPLLMESNLTLSSGY
jgi:uracil-DNA glycosylase